MGEGDDWTLSREAVRLGQHDGGGGGSVAKLIHQINNDCPIGCSDFDFFHILRYNHPSLTP